MANKNDPKRSTPNRVIDLDAALGNAPEIRLGGETFAGRELNLIERQRWLDAEAAADREAQQGVIAALLNTRGGSVTAEWVGERTQSQLTSLVRTLFGVSEDGGEGNA